MAGKTGRAGSADGSLLLSSVVAGFDVGGDAVFVVDDGACDGGSGGDVDVISADTVPVV